uniref:sensor histidine kinase n=1 Tax=Streptomyces clavuligerus TaxID=1901 RepID=UPI001E4087D5
EVPHPVPVLSADPVRLRQAVGNLLSNAVRHTPRGGSVTLRAAEPPAGHERQDAAGPPARPGAGPAGQRRALGPGRGRKTAD